MKTTDSNQNTDLLTRGTEVFFFNLSSVYYHNM